jgi:hypothetical protein
MQPWIHPLANEGAASWLRKLHPLRLQYELFSTANPFMSHIASMAEVVRQNRQSVSKENIFAQAEASASNWIETALNSYRDLRDELTEAASSTFRSLARRPAVTASEGARRRPD